MVMDQGRIAEMGSHQELMEKNGIYRHIYDMQMQIDEAVLASSAAPNKEV